MNITATKTVATNRAASTRKVIVMTAMVIFLALVFASLNVLLPAFAAAVLTIPAATAILYIVALAVVPGARPTKRR